MDNWALAFLVIAAILVAVLSIRKCIQILAKAAYQNIKSNPSTDCNIDAFVGPSNPVNAVKVVLAYKIQLGNRQASADGIPLQVVHSPHVEGLRVSSKLTEGAALSVSQLLQECAAKKKPAIVIATLRMGYGHFRLAYSVASWALQTGHDTVFHDFLSIESAESDLIKSTDELYSRFSRMASEWGGPMEKLWGAAMKQGDANALRIAANTSAHLRPLLLDYPKDTPIICTHQLCALTAAAAGFTNVINLVVDNWPQWFLTVPKTLNIVQGPVNYQSFLRFGIKPQELQWTGHWCPYELVQNIKVDCERRIERAANGTKVRILIPVGGAGAQRTFILDLVKSLVPLVQEGKVQLLLNAGDHAHMRSAFLQLLDEYSIDFETVEDTQGVRRFQERLLSSKEVSIEAEKNITLFTFDEYFPAVATTDLLCRCTDILCCKPSELAFYCVPKLHIRRVGDHEAASAKRSSELGDGTEEAREVDDALDYIKLFLQSPNFLISMNQAIINNNAVGIYDGCRKAVDLALRQAEN